MLSASRHPAARALGSVLLFSLAAFAPGLGGGVAQGAEAGDDLRPAEPAVSVEFDDRCRESRVYLRTADGSSPATANELRVSDEDETTAAVLAGDGSVSLELRFIGAPRWFNRVQARTDAGAFDIEVWNLDREWTPFEGDFFRGAGIVDVAGQSVKVRGLRFTPRESEEQTGEVRIYRLSAFFDYADPDHGDGQALLGGGNEYHYDWANDYPLATNDLSKCDNDAQGLADQLPSGWATPGHGDSNAHEVHFKRTDQGGSNGDHVDDGDLSYYAGHGSNVLWDAYWARSHGGIILGNQAQDDATGMPGDAHDAYGDGDQEWLVLAVCLALDLNSRPYWHDTFAGSHLLCGAETNIDDANYGKTMGKKLVDNGVFDTAKTVKSSWFDAMEKKNGSGRTAIVIGETSAMGNDYLWGEGTVAADPTHDCCYTAWSFATSAASANEQATAMRFISDRPWDRTSGRTGADPIRIERKTPRGFTVELDGGLLSQPQMETLPVYNVVPAMIDSAYVRNAASFLCNSHGIFCGGDIGPGDPGDLNLIDGVHELRVCRNTGALHYEDVSRWLAWRDSAPQLPSPNAAIGSADQLLTSWGRRRPGATVREVDYLRQMSASHENGSETEDPDSSFATAIRVNYQRTLGTEPSYPVVGPGGSTTVAFGNNGRLLRVFEGGWRNVQQGNEVSLMTVSEAVDLLTTDGWDAAVVALRTPIDVLQIDVWEHAYYEMDCEESQTQIRPVYVFHCTLINESAQGGGSSQADIYVWADRAQPKSEILSPAGGTHVLVGSEVCFQGVGSDGVPPLTLIWRDDLGNLLGIGPNPCAFLEAPPDTGDGSADQVRTISLTVRDALGREGHDQVRIILDRPSDAPEAGAAAAEFGFESSHPNPFSIQTTIAFRSPAGLPTSLRVYDPAGRLIRTLFERESSPSVNQVWWDGRDDTGAQLGAGVYFYELVAGTNHTRNKVVLVR